MLHGAPWLETPVEVVEDHGDVFAVLLRIGATMRYPPHPVTHPWAPREQWEGTDVLQIYRVGDSYSVWKLWRASAFVGCYVNFETPVVRADDAVELTDCGLDIEVDPDDA